MSRIGKKIIELPAKVKLTISGEGAVNAEGPKGKASWTLPKPITGRVDGTKVHIECQSEDRKHRALHGLSRALINNPEVIFADEATGNLDSKTSMEIMGVFQKLNEQGITIVMVTHELDIASYTKRNIIMRDGKVVTDEAVKSRLIAENELSKLRSAQEAVNLA